MLPSYSAYSKPVVTFCGAWLWSRGRVSKSNRTMNGKRGVDLVRAKWQGLSVGNRSCIVNLFFNSVMKIQLLITVDNTMNL